MDGSGVFEQIILGEGCGVIYVSLWVGMGDLFNVCKPLFN